MRFEVILLGRRGMLPFQAHFELFEQIERVVDIGSHVSKLAINKNYENTYNLSLYVGM